MHKRTTRQILHVLRFVRLVFCKRLGSFHRYSLRQFQSFQWFQSFQKFKRLDTGVGLASIYFRLINSCCLNLSHSAYFFSASSTPYFSSM
jgi:hypothetical protein